MTKVGKVIDVTHVTRVTQRGVGVTTEECVKRECVSARVGSLGQTVRLMLLTTGGSISVQQVHFIIVTCYVQLFIVCLTSLNHDLLT